jgi:hypothetical protein
MGRQAHKQLSYVSSRIKVKNVQDGKKADQLELLCQEFHLSDDQLKNIGRHNSFLKGQCHEIDKFEKKTL